MTTNNWPDPARPGVPMFPERGNTWHWLGHGLLVSHWSKNGIIKAKTAHLRGFSYIGPVLTPDQIKEMRREERERIKKMVQCACDLGNIITSRQRDMIVAGIDSEAVIREMGDKP